MLVWGGGALWTLTRLFDDMFRDGDGTRGRASGVLRAPAPLRLPRKFKRLVGWSLQTSVIVVGLVFPISERGLFRNAWAVMTLLWLVGIGIAWGRWVLSGPRTEPLDIRQDPEAIDLIRDSGPGEPPHVLRWRASTRPSPHATVSRVLADLLKTNFLPSLTGGTQRWEVTVDGEPIAALTQSWTDAQWWPEPEWFVDPHMPFTGGQVAFTRRAPGCHETCTDRPARPRSEDRQRPGPTRAGQERAPETP